MLKYIKLFEEWEPAEDWEEVDPEDQLSTGVHKLIFKVRSEDKENLEWEEEAASKWSEVIDGKEVRVNRMDGFIDGNGDTLIIQLTNGDTVTFKTFIHASGNKKVNNYCTVQVNQRKIHTIATETYVDDSCILGTTVVTALSYYKDIQENRLTESWEEPDEWDAPDNDDLRTSGLINQVDDQGRKIGYWETYYPDGKLELKATYKEGKMDGFCEYHSKSGDWQTGPFIMGHKVGHWISYDKDNNITHEVKKGPTERLHEDWEAPEEWDQVDSQDRSASGIFKTQFELDGDEDMIDQEKRAISNWSTEFKGTRIFVHKVEGTVENFHTYVTIFLSNGDRIETDAAFDSRPTTSSEAYDDHANISINDDDWVELRVDEYWRRLEDLGSIIKAFIEFYKELKS